MAGAKEFPAILHGHTYIVAHFQHISDGFAMLFAPVGTFNEEHISTLRLADGDTVKVLFNVIAGEIHIAGQYLPQLFQPFVAFPTPMP